MAAIILTLADDDENDVNAAFELGDENIGSVLSLSYEDAKGGTEGRKWVHEKNTKDWLFTHSILRLSTTFIWKAIFRVPPAVLLLVNYRIKDELTSHSKRYREPVSSEQKIAIFSMYCGDFLFTRADSLCSGYVLHLYLQYKKRYPNSSYQSLMVLYLFLSKSMKFLKPCVVFRLYQDYHTVWDQSTKLISLCCPA